jgi:hypothetical protein
MHEKPLRLRLLEHRFEIKTFAYVDHLLSKVTSEPIASSPEEAEMEFAAVLRICQAHENRKQREAFQRMRQPMKASLN